MSRELASFLTTTFVSADPGVVLLILSVTYILFLYLLFSGNLTLIAKGLAEDD